MDVYVESIVTRQITAKDKAVKTMWIAITVVMGIVASFGGILLIPFFLVTWAMAAHFIRRMSAMYEYVYMNGEMTFTRMTTNKRKKLFSCDMDHVEQVCFYKEFKNPGRQKAYAKTYDFASGVPGNSLYVMVVNTEKGKVKVFIEPEAEFLDAMWRHSPRVVQKARF